MPLPLLHFVLIQHGPALDADQPQVLHFDIKGHTDHPTFQSTPVNLLLVDVRRMSDHCCKVAFETANRLRVSTNIQHSVLVCEQPRLPIVVAAMRAGLRDVVQEAMSARQLVRLLRRATANTHISLRQLSALIGITRALSANSPPRCSRDLGLREYELIKRSEHLDNQETRLALERAALEDREQKLRISTRRFERDFAAMQKDSDIIATLHSAPPFSPNLDGLASQLADRAKSLDIRERMLQEVENILLGQLSGKPAHPLEVDTRPPFAFSLKQHNPTAA